MPLDKVEGTLQFVDQHRADDEGDTKSQRIAKQHQRSLHGASLLRCKRQSRAEERADAGRPAHRKDTTEQKRGEKSKLTTCHAVFDARKELDLEYAEEIEAEKDHQKSGDDIDHCAMPCEEAAHRAGKRAHQHEHQGKAKHESKRIAQGFGGFAFTATCEIGDVDRKHRQKARGDKGYDALNKRDKIFHI